MDKDGAGAREMLERVGRLEEEVAEILGTLLQEAQEDIEILPQLVAAKKMLAAQEKLLVEAFKRIETLEIKVKIAECGVSFRQKPDVLKKIKKFIRRKIDERNW